MRASAFARRIQTHKGTRSSPDDDNELAQIWSIIGKRVASIIFDRGTVASSEDRKSTVDRKRQSVEVCDRGVADTMYRRVLERNDCVI